MGLLIRNDSSLLKVLRVSAESDILRVDLCGEFLPRQYRSLKLPARVVSCLGGHQRKALMEDLLRWRNFILASKCPMCFEKENHRWVSM